mmetsp:Transcript_22105/g.87702  ORF Transcript_22105/g.87702 Transcript_22105/m.87702 type:complete len:254 (-) Transcript_22105:189-950(-)
MCWTRPSWKPPRRCKTLCHQVDARDVEGRWFEADVVEARPDELRLHYRSWNSSFDDTVDRDARDKLAPLFTHCLDWRPRVKRGQLIEAKQDRCWYLAIVVRVVFPERRPSERGSLRSWTTATRPRWSKLDAIGVNSSRENETLRVVTSSVPRLSDAVVVNAAPATTTTTTTTTGAAVEATAEHAAQHHLLHGPPLGEAAAAAEVLRWTVTDFDSEDIAPLGTHIRPGEAGKHYTTNSITMPMSLMIELMAGWP